MSLWKKTMIGTLAFTLVAGGSTSALAATPGWSAKPWERNAKQEKRDDDKKEEKNRKDDKKDDKKHDDGRSIVIEINGKKVELKFDDVRVEASWALQYIAELVRRGVFTGYEDGSFRPNQKVTRIEAITAAVRQMGLRAQAESAEEMATKLNFKDADKIEKKYPWAVGYVAVALENDLFLETDTEVQPEKPADRQWATVLLVKALGLEDEAKAKMNTNLSFKDKNEIAAGAVGYIAVALEKGLVTGYENNTFRPNQPVTRAELAALLDRTGDQIPDSQTGYGQIDGTFNGLSNGKLTVTKDGKTSAYAVSQDVTIVRNNALVPLASLVAGDRITAVVSNGSVIHVTVTEPVGVTDGQFTGAVTAVSGSKLTVAKDGATKEYTVKNDAVIIRNNAVATLSQVRPGDQVTIVVSGGVVVHVTVTQPAAENGQKSGVVTAVADKKVTIAKDGTSAQYPAANNIVVVRNGAVVELKDVKVGDQVTVALVNGAIVHLSVTTAVAENGEVEGIVSAVSGNKVTLVRGGATTEYGLSNGATIVRNGAVVSIDRVLPGDKVKAVLLNGAILYLTVTEAVTEENDAVYKVEGKYQGHRVENGKLSQISVTTQQDGNPVTRIYNVASDVAVNGGNAFMLEPGKTTIELIVANQQVTVINIKS